MDKELLGSNQLENEIPKTKGLMRGKSESISISKRLAWKTSKSLKTLSSGVDIRVQNVDSPLDTKTNKTSHKKDRENISSDKSSDRPGSVPR